jgi:hypothetical protein
MGIDLGRFLTNVRKAAEPAKAEITGIILSKNSEDLLEQVQDLLKAEGLEFGVSKTFDDGTAVLSKEEDFETDTQVVQYTDNVALVVKGFQPYSDAMNELSFGQAAEVRGLYPGMESAMGVLRDMVWQKLSKADSPESAAADLAPVMGEFVQYVTTLVKSLPSQVFKIERPLETMISEFKAPESEVKTVEVDPVRIEKSEEQTEQQAATTETPPVAAAETPAVTQELVLKTVTEAMAGFKTTLDEFGVRMKELGDQVKATEVRVDAAVTKAEDAVRVVKGTVVSGTPSGDALPAGVRKSEELDTFDVGNFDSAYQRTPSRTRR